MHLVVSMNDPRNSRNVSNQTLSGRSTRPGRKPEYRDQELIDLITLCWLGRERMCAKRLVIQLESFLEEYEHLNGKVDADLRLRFLDISAATIDRILKPFRDQWYRENPRHALKTAA